MKPITEINMQKVVAHIIAFSAFISYFFDVPIDILQWCLLCAVWIYITSD